MIKKTSAIICAYNESATIINVVLTLCKSALVDEIIVINDGSADDTSSKLRALSVFSKVVIIESSVNRGKGYALSVGILRAKNDILLFVDGDIINLSQAHIERLLQPLLNGIVHMVIGQPTDTIIGHKSNPFIPLSGQRAMFKKDIFPIVNKLNSTRFGVETLINLHYKVNKLEVKYEYLYGLKHPIKFHKYSFVKAIGEYFRAGYQILKTLTLNHKLLIFYFSLIIKRNFLNL